MGRQEESAGGRLAYPIDDAANVIGITRSRIYVAVKKGELRTYLEGRRRMVSARALQEYVARREREAAAAEPARAVG